MDLNVDLKSLFKKKDGAGSKAKDDDRKNKGITQFLEKNPKMKVIIPALLVLIAILVALVIVIKTGSVKLQNIPADTKDASKVQILPQDVRDYEDISQDGSVLDEDVLSHPKVTAIMYNSDGYYTATVETDTASYPHLQVGDYVGDSSWLVESITETEVVFSLGDETVEVEVKF